MLGAYGDNMYGSAVTKFITIPLTLFIVMDICRVLGCSPPNYRQTRSFRARAHDAEVVVFATVIDSPADAKDPINAYYSARLSLHCILKGPQLPRVITVHGFGNDGGGCTRTDAITHKSYIFLLRNIHGQYRPHNVGIAPAAKRAREKILLRFLPDFWSTSHRPYKRRPLKARAMHCPTLKKMKRILRKSTRRFIQSHPVLLKKKRQLKEWLKKLRNDRKKAKGELDWNKQNASTVITQIITERQYKPTLTYNSSKSNLAMKNSLAKRSLGNEDGRYAISLANATSSASRISATIGSVAFVWCMIYVLEK